MFSWIRWWGLIVFVVIFGGGTAFFMLAAGPLAKLSIEKIGTMVNGALVEVDSAAVTFNPLGLKVTGLQVADEAQPMRNVLEFKQRSEEHTSELQSRPHLVCRLLLEKKKKKKKKQNEKKK